MSPYDLRAGQSDSNFYYAQVAQAADELTRRGRPIAKPLVDKYKTFITEGKEEPLRSDEEYMVELLTLALLWNIYAAAAMRGNKPALAVMERLFKLRRQRPSLKKVVDPVRGVLQHLVLSRALKAAGDAPAPSLRNFKRFVRFLAASGEFKDEVQRFECWQRFFEETDVTTDAEVFEVCRGLRMIFEAVSKSKLLPFTVGVPTFVAESEKSHHFREDELFVSRRRREYHLNMLGAEIMNRGFAPEFEKTKRRVVLAPGCMRANEATCRARRGDDEWRCVGCDKSCNMHRLWQKGQEHGFEVCVIPHSSSFTQWLKRWQDEPETGLVAVACPLNIIAGGYEMRKLSLKAQCVVLDYCGCKKHWHDRGIPTDLNTQQLEKLAAACG